jgi:integrase
MSQTVEQSKTRYEGVRKRGEKYTATWPSTRYDAATGKHVRFQASKGGFPTAKAAAAYRRGMLTQRDKGVVVEPSKVTLAEYLEGWLRDVQDTIRSNSYRAYASLSRNQLVRRSIGAVPLRSLTSEHVTTLLREMADEGLSVDTRRAAVATLSRALQDAVKSDKLTRNVAHGVSLPSVPRSAANSAKRAWTTEELQSFLAHASKHRLWALWRLAATTGMRRGELCGLTRSNLKLDAGRLTVDRQLHHNGRFGDPKSGNGFRAIKLDEGTVAALRDHLAGQDVERKIAGSDYDDHDLVFCSPTGRPLATNHVGVMFVKLRKQAGIPVGTLHTLRHTVATTARTNNAALHLVAAYLGDSERTIAEHYTHIQPDAVDRVADIMSAALA